MEGSSITTSQILLTVVSSLISGIVGVVISTVYYRKYEKHKVKMDTTRRLLGSRYNILGECFTQALNEAFVIFHDSPQVMKALAEFHQVATSRQSAIANDKLVSLFKSICKDVRIDYRSFNDSYFLQPFNPDPRTTTVQQGAQLGPR